MHGSILTLRNIKVKFRTLMALLKPKGVNLMCGQGAVASWASPGPAKAN
jgi:hypothetical protein